MTEKRKPGRPALAAQTVEEALRAVATGTAPTRPRNEIERLVSGKARGRKEDRRAPVWQAAALARYLIDNDSKTVAEAVRVAASAYEADRSNVRRYLKKLGPLTVKVEYTGPANPLFPRPAPTLLPFCIVEDV